MMTWVAESRVPNRCLRSFRNVEAEGSSPFTSTPNVQVSRGLRPGCLALGVISCAIRARRK